jgi:hypothetical protein
MASSSGTSSSFVEGVALRIRQLGILSLSNCLTS